MSSSFNLGVNLSTAQKLTPQMQQAIKLLQLSSLELEQEVQNKLDSNPLLELIEEDNINAEDFNSIEELTRLELDAEAQKEVYELANDHSEGYETDAYDEYDYDNPSEAYQSESAYEKIDNDSLSSSDKDPLSQNIAEIKASNIVESTSDDRSKADELAEAKVKLGFKFFKSH